MDPCLTQRLPTIENRVRQTTGEDDDVE